MGWAVDWSIYPWLPRDLGFPVNMMDDSQGHMFCNRKKDKERERERLRESERDKWRRNEAISFYF